MVAPGNTEKPKSFWANLPVVVKAFAGLLTAAAALIAALSAAGVFESDEPSTTNAPATPITAAPLPAATAAPVAPIATAGPAATPAPVTAERASIEIVYTGDEFGCNLPITVQIGDQTAQPTGNRYTMTNVMTGLQNYAISGTIACFTLGECRATGSGLIDVVANGSYLVVWQQLDVFTCQVTLQ